MTDRECRVLLAARRERLILHAAVQRRRLGASVIPLAQALGWVERGIAAGAWLRGRPWVLLGPAALLLWWRPRGLWRVVGGASALWRGGRSLQRLFGI